MFYPSPQLIEPVVKKAYIKYDYDEDDELFLLTDENDEDIAFFDKKKIYHSYEEACNAKIDMMERYMNFLVDKEGELRAVIHKYKKMLEDVLNCKKTLIDKYELKKINNESE